MGAFEHVKNFFRTSSSSQEAYIPQPLAEPTRGAAFNRFADMLPYTGYIKENGLFVIEGDAPGSVEALGFVLEMVPQTGAPQEMAEIMTSVFLGVPAGTSFQWQLLASPETEPFIRAYENCRMDPDQIPESAATLKEQARLYQTLFRRRAEHFRKGSTNALIPGTGEYSRDGKNWMIMMQTDLNKVPE